MNVGVRPPWLPLLRRLSEIAPEWGLWKNADSALEGHGDIDSVAQGSHFPVLAHEFALWAVDQGLSPVFSCTHILGVMLLVGVRSDAGLVELDLCERQTFRGSTLFWASDLTGMMQMDEKGFRRLRPGAEGLLLLFLSGVRYGGRDDTLGLRSKGVRKLLRQDPEGAHMASSLFGPARGPASRLAAAVAEGRWDWASALQTEIWATLRSLREPGVLQSRLRFRRSLERKCALWRAITNRRVIPGDRGAWIAEMMSTHRRLDTT